MSTDSERNANTSPTAPSAHPQSANSSDGWSSSDALLQAEKENRARMIVLRLIAAGVLIFLAVAGWRYFWLPHTGFSGLEVAHTLWSTLCLLATVAAVYSRPAWLRLCGCAATVACSFLFLNWRLFPFFIGGWDWLRFQSSWSWLEIAGCVLGLMTIRLYVMEIAQFRQSVAAGQAKLPDKQLHRRFWPRLLTLVGLTPLAYELVRKIVNLPGALDPLWTNIHLCMTLGAALVPLAASVFLFLPATAWRLFGAGMCAYLSLFGGVFYILSGSLKVYVHLFGPTSKGIGYLIAWEAGYLIIVGIGATGAWHALKLARQECASLAPAPAISTTTSAASTTVAEADDDPEDPTDGTWDEARPRR